MKTNNAFSTESYIPNGMWSLLQLVLILFLLTQSFALADGKATPIPLSNGVFKVENDGSAHRTHEVATIEYRPQSSMYVVRGRVQYNDVEGVAYLEMWNVMPDGSRFFSRTLAEQGPMQKIQPLYQNLWVNFGSGSLPRA